ncbi:BTAD domain-containing putative transcriptional regulator [Streptomyces sp. NPDC048106]|uniref:AfsR/SARP family transcriptional regulator n=1 Tax=Streptomyces sp. NPDC048106 TaxID=3155750 RepID=UPI003452158F
MEADPRAGVRDVEFKLLGPLEVWSGADRVNPGGAKQRQILATLLLCANRVTPISRLLQAAWEEEMPLTATNQVRKMVWDLRRKLPAGGRIVTEPPGYRLVLRDEQLDARRFETLLSRAEAAVAEGGAQAAIAHLGSALELWRGRALAGMTGSVLTCAGRDLDERRLVATERWIDLRLSCGEARALVPVLQSLVAEHPLHETLRERLMLALYRIGRRAEALDVFAQGRAGLLELGIDPGAALARLQERILNDDPELLLSEQGRSGGETVVLTAPEPVPRVNGMLPYDLPDFTGRQKEMDALARLAAGVSHRAPLLVTVNGMPGVGKTALAVRAAHRLAGAFPDGQLFVDMRGFTREGGPLPLADALRRLLLSLREPARDIPDDLDGRLAMWRLKVAGRRILLVLDNVCDTAAIRPLLPSTGGCMVVVTSRVMVNDLDGAVSLPVGPLPEQDAMDLLAEIIGSRRMDDAEEARTLVSQCGRLPLAVRIIGTRLNNRHSWTLAYATWRLRRENRRLRELSLADRGVADELLLSYRRLRPDQQRMLLILGTVASGGFDSRTAGSLAAVPVARAEELLEELVDACLLLPLPTPGRYHLHELVRSFALAQAAAPGDEEAPPAALAHLPVPGDRSGCRCA